MYQLQYDKNPNIRFIIVSILFILSAIILLFGVQSLIEHKSPENLGSLNSLGHGFITYFKYHLLIIFGALGFTLTLWLRERYKYNL